MHFARAAVPFVALFQRLLFAILVQALLQCHGLLFLLFLQLTLALQLGLLCFELLCLMSVTRSKGEKKELKCELGVEKVDFCSHIHHQGHDDSQRFDSSAWQHVAKAYDHPNDTSHTYPYDDRTQEMLGSKCVGSLSQQYQEHHTKHSRTQDTDSFLIIQKQWLLSTCTRTWM